ncbi:MAG: glycosyltransferase family 4 protein [Tatlockia sp.]|nr:glycosyltransferase family 4 protein [Tatlockia sp.]
MKLMLFTPVIKTSAIGRMASLVARKLSSYGHEIIVIRSENESFFNQPIHNFGVLPISWYEFSQINEHASSVDKVIYQIGDNFDFHQGCIPWLAQLSGVVCLHDFYLGNLFYLWGQTNRLEACSILNAWYGSEAAKHFFSYKNSETLIEGTLEKYPMTEWICSLAEAVITHSNWGIERVLKSCPGPVRVVPLPYDAPHAKTSENYTTEATKDKLRILTVGHVNKNKRTESVIKAIGKSRELRSKIVYQLAGYVSSETEYKLSKLAKKQKVNLIVSGVVSDSILAEAINQADMISCFRWPALEAASASTIEALLYGKPTMVINTGFYSEIPDNFTIKINPENEINEIQKVLENLIKDPGYYRALGQQAQLWAMQVFSADNYVLKLSEVVLTTTRTSVVTEAINTFSKIMYNWGNEGELIGKEYIIKPLTVFSEVL